MIKFENKSFNNEKELISFLTNALNKERKINDILKTQIKQTENALKELTNFNIKLIKELNQIK